MSKKEYIPYGIALLALLIATLYDYPITAALYHSSSIFGIVFARLVLVPIEYVVVFTMCMLCVHYHRLLFAGIAMVASFYILQHATRFWVTSMDGVIQAILLLAAIALTLLTLYVIKHLDAKWIEQKLPFFLFFTIVLLSAALCTTILKTLWGRIRFRDLQDASLFRAWYLPAGINGNHSFPSGHMTGITSIICIVQWKRNRFKKLSIWVYVCIIALIVAMGISRMIMGAHYLSDLTIGCMITYTCYLITRYQFRKRGYL